MIEELLVSNAKVGAKLVTPYDGLGGAEEAFADDEGWNWGWG